MTEKSDYEVLDVAPTASFDEIRRAFRRAIGRYHPDKVQHLGVEFVDIAAARTAEITRAYRALCDRAARTNHDASVEPKTVPPQGGSGLSVERAGANALVRRAALERWREALRRELGSCEDALMTGFDLAATSPQGALWGRGERMRVLVRVVDDLDAAAVRDSWAAARRHEPGGALGVCVFVLGPAVASPEALRQVVDDLYRRPARQSGTLSLIPVDIRTWSAHVPAHAPFLVAALLRRLRAA